MAEKTLKSRIIHKHDTAANWLKGANFIPKQGEIIVYDIDADHNYERFKIGDGKTAVNSLPFADGALKDYVDTELGTLVDDIATIDALVGDTSVASQISTAIANKADASHTHDDRYYTESEINTKLNAKADANHTHDISGLSVSYATTAGTANAVAWANVTSKPSTYTPASHSHAISDVTNLQTTLNGKVPTSRTVNGKALSADITLSASDVGADASGAANTALTNANSYTDNRITAMVGDKTVANQISTAISAVEEQIIDPTFYVTFTKETNTTYTADKTYAAVEAAYTAGQNVIGLLDLGLEMLYHIPMLYCVTGYAIAFHTNIESSDPITIAYGADGTIVVQTYAKLASKTDVSDAIAAIVHPVTSVNGKTGAVTLNASNVGADASGSASTALTNAKSYTDTRISAMVGDKAVSEQITTAIAAKADSGHTHDDRYYTESEVDTKLNTKANSSHGNHVPATETANNAKFLRNDNTWQTVTPANIGAAAASHGTHVSYSTTAPVMDGTASAGSASTVARSDHKHPTDTSRASASSVTSLQNLVGDTAVSTQISNAVANKADTGHKHVVADITNIVISATEPSSPTTGMLWFDIS